jgi:hypothetical protein
MCIAASAATPVLFWDVYLALLPVKAFTDCTWGGHAPFKEAWTECLCALAMIRLVTNNGLPSWSCTAEGMPVSRRYWYAGEIVSCRVAAYELVWRP